ncbi:hypothetical protein BLOT_009500 [Blomia tropicalis]|nr:hypothetical protein BLOT_009500 [Blomia tropicalis]
MNDKLKPSNEARIENGIVVNGYETHIFIRYGTIYSYKSEYPLARVRQIRKHPDYMYRYGELINDIALLILDRKLRPSKDVGYAKLPTFNFNNKQKVFVYGWSGVDLGEQCSATLRKAEMIARPSWQTVTAQQAECRSVRNLPSIVQLLYGINEEPFCAGILITGNRVLTDAHCVYNYYEEEYEEVIYIRYGTIYSYKSEYPLARVLEIRRHSNYRKVDGANINDIAILILDRFIKSTKDVGYAKLPTSNFNDRRKVFVYGWSGKDFGEDCSSTLRKTEMIIRPTWQCVKLNATECKNVKDCKVMCATSKFSGISKGDSGGPVFLRDKTLVGIVSSFLENSSLESPPWEEDVIVKVFLRLNFINLKEKKYCIKKLELR